MCDKRNPRTLRRRGTKTHSKQWYHLRNNTNVVEPGRRGSRWKASERICGSESFEKWIICWNAKQQASLALSFFKFSPKLESNSCGMRRHRPENCARCRWKCTYATFDTDEHSTERSDSCVFGGLAETTSGHEKALKLSQFAPKSISAIFLFIYINEQRQPQSFCVSYSLTNEIDIYKWKSWWK